jgi:hypothetical protein
MTYIIVKICSCSGLRNGGRGQIGGGPVQQPETDSDYHVEQVPHQLES